jgi:Peptidase MA superfamily
MLAIFLFYSIRDHSRPYLFSFQAPCLSGIAILLWGFFALAPPCSHAADFNALKGNGVEVLFPPTLEQAAKETAQMTPQIKKDLQETFNWPFSLNPTVILMDDSQRFRQLTHSPLVVGFAVPGKNLVVIDYARIRNPLQFRNILKHELCHLLLHEHVDNVPIPRWFDEGIAQWTSNGVMDILHDPKDALLPKAAFSDRISPLGALNKGFPGNANALRLAYEESRSFIDYIISTHGKPGLLEILRLMKNGATLRKAVIQALGTPLYKIEENWRSSLKKNIVWFAHLSYYLYEILFAVGGLMVIYAFIKVLRKKRAYMEEE